MRLAHSGSLGHMEHSASGAAHTCFLIASLELRCHLLDSVRITTSEPPLSSLTGLLFGGYAAPTNTKVKHPFSCTPILAMFTFIISVNWRTP